MIQAIQLRAMPIDATTITACLAARGKDEILSVH
jgi:hypothetical protein